MKMIGYKSARDEYKDNQGIFLDANESPYGNINRYPDPYQKKLKNVLSIEKSLSTNEIFIGNGSDEIIDLLFRIFCRPAQDKSISFSPGYGMYKVSAAIQDIEHINLKLDDTFQIKKEELTPYLSDSNIKLMFICSPNNPCGNIINPEDIQWIIERFDGIVVIDEAYIDFSESESWVSEIKKYQRLIIIQTMSKSWGLAGARIGIAYTNPTIINLLNKVKPPYNVSTLNEKAALKALDNRQIADLRLKAIVSERKRVYHALKNINSILKVHPSEANFLLIEVEDANTLYYSLITQKIIVRNQSSKLRGCLRLSIGTPDENNRLLAALNDTQSTEIQLSEYGLGNSPDLTNRH